MTFVGTKLTISGERQNIKIEEGKYQKSSAYGNNRGLSEASQTQKLTFLHPVTARLIQVWTLIYNMIMPFLISFVFYRKANWLEHGKSQQDESETAKEDSQWLGRRM